jgi:hypothetical protein
LVSTVRLTFFCPLLQIEAGTLTSTEDLTKAFVAAKKYVDQYISSGREFRLRAKTDGSDARGKLLMARFPLNSTTEYLNLALLAVRTQGEDGGQFVEAVRHLEMATADMREAVRRLSEVTDDSWARGRNTIVVVDLLKCGDDLDRAQSKMLEAEKAVKEAVKARLGVLEQVLIFNLTLANADATPIRFNPILTLTSCTQTCSGLG